MKYFRDIYKLVLSSLLLFIIGSNIQINAQSTTDTSDSIEVSLLTCSPHTEVYSLYGHTAIRYKDMRTGEDWTFNYGVFNFNKPYFVLRFVFGLTDYELGVLPFDIFQREYSKNGRYVTEQVLNLTTEEKLNIRKALEDNYMPQNRVYRYNFIYDNCTTRARNIIEQSINGEIRYDKDGEEASYREMLHEYTVAHPWAAVGNDLCLGAKADKMTDYRERQFLPNSLMTDFDKAQIYTNGQYRPLVKRRDMVVEPSVQFIEKEFPLSPTECAVALLILSVAIAALETKKKKTSKIWDITLMFIVGISGTIILALFFSEHPTTSTNLQILLLNPLPLLYIYKVAKGKKTIYWKISLALIILFFAGAMIQDYAEGMEIVALSLLCRVLVHLKLDNNR